MNALFAHNRVRRRDGGDSLVLWARALRLTSVAVLCLALWPAAAAASGWEVTAEVDKSRVSKQDILTYKIVVEGAGTGTPELVQAPAFKDFEQLSTSTGTSIVDRNGRVSSAHRFVFRLSPKRAGTLHIGSATVEVGGLRRTTLPLEVQVANTSSPIKPRPRTPAPGYGGGGGGGSGGGGTWGGSAGPAPGAPGITAAPAVPVPLEGEDYFIEVTSTRDSVYLGEPFHVRYDLYRLANLVPALYDVRDPDFTGFVHMETTANYTVKRLTRAGRRYAREPVRGYVLVPIEAGDLVISPVEVDVPTHAGLVQSPTRPIASPSLDLRVRPLPLGAPAGFDPANVGRDLKLEALARGSAGATTDSMRVGDALVVSVTISGQGLVDAMRLAPVDDAGGDVLVFGPELKHGSMEVKYDQLVGLKRMNITYVPTREGDVHIPAIRLVHFDLESEAYKTVEVGPWDIHVEGRAEHADDVAAHALALRRLEEEEDGEDVFAALAGPREVVLREPRSTDHRPPYETLWFFLLMAAPPMGYLLLVINTAWRRRRDTSKEQRESEGAAKAARGEVRRARRGAAAPEKALGSMASALHTYLMARFGVRARSMTRHQLGTALRSKGIPAADATVVCDLLEALSLSRYAPSEEGSIGVDEAAGRVRDAVDQLEGIAKRESGRTP